MKKALILAAGYGTRMMPFTHSLPKALIPLWGVPLLEHSLRRLEKWGVEEIVVNAHAHAGQIQDFVTRRKNRAKVSVRVEPEILGTGGALKPLRGFFGDDPFWVLNADAAASVGPEGMVKAFHESGSFASVWLDAKRGPRTVEADRKMRLTCYKSEEPGADGTFTFCGLHLLSPAIFDYLDEQPFSSVISAYERAMHDGLFAVGFVDGKSYWADCGTPEALRKIHAEVKSAAFSSKPGGELYSSRYDRIPLARRGYFCVCPKATVPDSVKGDNSVIMPGTVLVDKTRVSDSVLFGGSYAGQVEGVNAVAADRCGSSCGPEVLLAKEFGGRKTGIQSLGARGSDRSFWRLFQGDRRAIGIIHSGARKENDRYARHAKLLEEIGVPVPAIYRDNPLHRVLIMEDCGCTSLQSAVKARPYDAHALYGPVVRSLALMHRDGLGAVQAAGLETEPEFDAELYAWERNLFVEHLLDGRYGISSLPDDAARDMEKIAAKMLKQPKVLVHRDMQSSNVLLRGKRHWFIDFQGMRPGAAVYDLASLLFDPYVSLCPGDRQQLAEEYASYFPERPEVKGEMLMVGALQRLTQALGAFGRLSSVGQPSFALYIRPALDGMLELAERCRFGGIAAMCCELLDRERWRRDRMAMPEDSKREEA